MVILMFNESAGVEIAFLSFQILNVNFLTSCSQLFSVILYFMSLTQYVIFAAS